MFFIAEIFFGTFWNFVLLVCVVVLFIRTSKLKDRLSKLEKGEKNTDKISVPNLVSNVINEDYRSLSSETQKYTEESKLEDNLKNKEEFDPSGWFKENLLLKVGILMILLGFGWFVSYAFAHNWIGPVGRITLGIFTGVLVTLFANFRFKKNQIQGRAFTILGTALVVISVLAGEYYYSFFTSEVVLALVFIISLYTTLTSVVYDDEKLAIYGITVSLFAPYLSHTLGMDKFTLFFYLLIASFAVIWVTLFKKWKSVSAVGLTGIFLYSLNSIFLSDINFYEAKYGLLLLGYSISFVYLTINIWGMVKNTLGADVKDIYLSILNTILILGFTIQIIPNIYQSLILVAWTLIYILTGFFVFMKTKNNKLFYMHSLIAVLFLGIATSIELKGPTLVIAFAIESAMLVLVSYIITNNIKVSESVFPVFALPIAMSIQSVYSIKWRDSIFHSDFVVLFLLALLLLVLGLFFKLNDREDKKDFKIYLISLIMSSVYVFILIWLCIHTIVVDTDTAVFFSLFIYTIIGLFTHFYGLFNGSDLLRKYGMVVLTLIVVRLLLVDVWDMDLALRVITFIVLGVMFIGSTFISKRQNTI